MAKSKKEETFEELLNETEEAVEELESGELPLEEAMKLYEKGIRNLTACSTMIEKAQTRVQQLMEEKAGKLNLEDFDEEEPEVDE